METYRTDTAVASQFSVESVPGRTWSTLFRNPGVFFGLTSVSLLLSILIELLLPRRNAGRIVGNVVDMVLTQGIQGAIAYGVFQSLRGYPASIGEAVSRGMSRIGPLFLAALLVALGVGLGTLLFVIPGLVLMCMWVVTVPACVVERLGAADALGRSTRLTEGHRMKIFGLLLLVFLAGFGCSKLSEFLVLHVLPASRFLGILTGFLLGLLPYAFSSVMTSIIYYDLRADKEGITLDSLANVFD